MGCLLDAVLQDEIHWAVRARVITASKRMWGKFPFLKIVTPPRNGDGDKLTYGTSKAASILFPGNFIFVLCQQFL